MWPWAMLLRVVTKRPLGLTPVLCSDGPGVSHAAFGDDINKTWLPSNAIGQGQMTLATLRGVISSGPLPVGEQVAGSGCPVPPCSGVQSFPDSIL